MNKYSAFQSKITCSGLSVNWTSLFCKLYLFQAILVLRDVLMLEVFSSEILKMVSFNP